VLLRIQILNAGKSRAVDTRVQFQRYWVSDLEGGDPPGLSLPAPDKAWRLRIEEPSLLRWTGLADEGATVPAKSSQFAELLLLHVNRAQFEFRTRHPFFGQHDLHSAKGRHRFELTYWADNVKPIATVVEVVVAGRNFVDSVVLVEAPLEFEEARLFRLLDGIGQEDPEDSQPVQDD